MEILSHAWLCLLSGHGLWNGTFTEHPPFDVPDAKGNYLPLALGGFYMFLTMIILLQVGGPPQLGAQKTYSQHLYNFAEREKENSVLTLRKN